MIALLLTGSAFASSCAAPAAPQASQASPKVASSQLFPEPKSGISIQTEPGKEMKCDELLAEFAKATGLHLVVNRETANLLVQTKTGLTDSLEIPRSEVYLVVESLLVNNDYVLTPLTNREPRLVGVYSMSQGGQRGSSLRNSAVFVPVEEVPTYSQHPAILVTTVIHLPWTDVRTLSNSMRTMFTDANTQQIVPVGNSNSLILTGFGPQVASLVAMLQSIDDAARRDAEKPHSIPGSTVSPEPPK